MDYSWNPWHGCNKISPGCLNCYVYRRDKEFDKDSTIVSKNSTFDLPIKKNKKGQYKIPSGSKIATCFTSDFLLDKADEWRIEAWKMIKERNDCDFLFITKRIDRFEINLPDDWNDGYDNVLICCTVENQKMADYRLPIFKKAKIKHKMIVCEPLLENIDLEKYLDSSIEGVLVGGESGIDARICDYEWILNIRNQCLRKKVNFTFRQTGAKLKKDGKVYFIKRKDQFKQVKLANIDIKDN